MNNIRNLRVERGLTMRELGDRMGVHFTTIAKIERSQRKLTPDWLMKFATALDVAPSEVSPEAAGLTSYPVGAIPVIGQVAAGSWREAIQTPEEMIVAPVNGAHVFGLRVAGESMNKIAPSGAIVLVDPDNFDLHDGGLYVVMNEQNDTTFKRYRTGPSRLEPLSTDDEHQPIALGREPFTVVGKVLGVYQAF